MCVLLKFVHKHARIFRYFVDLDMQTVVKKNDYREQENGDSSDLRFYFTDFLQEHGQKVLIGFLVALALVVLFYRMTATQSPGSVREYIEAGKEFARFQEPSLEQEEIYEHLKAVIEEHPSLQSKYDGLIGQTLLINLHPEEAQQYISRSLQRTHMDKFPPYAQFVQATFAIADHHFSAAISDLESARKDVSHSEDNISYALNLLREAMVNKKMGSFEQELTLLQELANYLEKPENAKVKQVLEKHFQDGSISLYDYIQNEKLQTGILE